MSTETVTIEKLGALGDGIASSAGGPVYVPFSLPGETVAIARVKSQGTIMSITTPSPDRQEPPCLSISALMASTAPAAAARCSIWQTRPTAPSNASWSSTR